MDDTAVVTVAAIEKERSSCFRHSPINHLGLFSYIQHVTKEFGIQFIFLLACNYFFLKGVVYVFISGVQLPYFKSLGLDGVQYQTFSVISLTPWAMKGLIGTVSDSFALGGYHKKYYMIICCTSGFLALCFLSFLPSHIMTHNVWISPILFFSVMFQIATLDLLIEGKYTEKMRDRPETNADLVTFVWSCITLGSLVASAVVGPVADHIGVSVIFYLCIPFSIILLIPLFLNFLPDAKVDLRLRNRLQVDKIREKGPLFLVAVTTAVAALVLALIGLFGSTTLQSSFSIVASFVMILIAYRAMPRQLANCNFYMYLQESLYISLAGALDFWYTADPFTCVPGGPGFDYTYYSTYTQLVGHGASILGLWVFQTSMSRWKFRHVYWITTLLRISSSLFDFLIVKRWNVSIGISDKLMYMLGDAIIMPITTMLNFMPGVLLTAKLCPHSMEATVYAILAGFSNFGSNTAKSIGVFLQKSFGIQTKEPNCNFDSLSLLILVCHCFVPLLCLPLTFLLLPDCGMAEPFPEKEAIDNSNENLFCSIWNGTTWKEAIQNVIHGSVPITRQPVQRCFSDQFNVKDSQIIEVVEVSNGPHSHFSHQSIRHQSRVQSPNFLPLNLSPPPTTIGLQSGFSTPQAGFCSEKDPLLKSTPQSDKNGSSDLKSPAMQSEDQSRSRLVDRRPSASPRASTFPRRSSPSHHKSESTDIR